MANKRRTFTRTQPSTFGADLGSVVRLNLNKFNPFHLGFVLDKVLQLEKTPITNPIIHSSSEISFSNPLQVFHYDFVSTKSGNYFLANVMINPTHEPLLFPRNLLKQSSAGMSAFALEFTSQEFEFSFNLFNFGGLEKLFIGCNSEIINPQVHPKNLILQVRVYGAFLRECKKKKASSFFINSQKAFSNLPTEIFFITIRNCKRNFNPTFDGGNTQNIIFERSTTREIISNRTEFNYWIGFCFLDNSTGLFDTGNSQLALQSHLLEFGIDKRMKLNIISNLHSPSNINTMLKSFFIEISSVYNLLSWFNLYFSSYPDLHKKINNQDYLNTSEGIFPPKPEGRGIQNPIFI